MKLELEKYCEFFYASHYVPVALHRGADRMAYYSSLDKPLDLSAALQPMIAASEKNPDIFTLPEQGQYGLIRVGGKGEYILVGPVFASPVTEATVLVIAHRNFIESNDVGLLGSFLSAIPHYSYNQFVSLVAYLHYSLNHETFDILGHFHEGSAVYESSLAAVHTENSFAAKEQQQMHGTYQFENMLLSYVRDGEMEKLNDFLLQTVKTTELREGALADTPLRQAKNLLIGTATMVGKVGAIGGGMDVEETYRLIDLYIQECEKAPSVDAVKMLQYNMILDFTDRVSQSKTPTNTSREVFACMQFIQNHTSYSIGIDSVAEYTGKSRSYITRKFRQEAGMSIMDFITQSKLRDAKRLLRYSDKTLAEISSYLCFSSQAYFHTVFKQATGLTPNEYRHKHWPLGQREAGQ